MIPEMFPTTPLGASKPVAVALPSHGSFLKRVVNPKVKASVALNPDTLYSLLITTL